MNWGKSTHYFLIFCCVLFFSCSSKEISGQPIAEKKVYLSSQTTDYLISIKTKHGEMKVILYDQTPEHKSNFIKLVRNGFYNDLLFHRVIRTFMAQGGDPESKGAPKEKPLGKGDPGYTLPAEFVEGFLHEKGALAAARLGDQANPTKASNGSQFYIVQGKVHTKEELLNMKVDFRKLYQLFGQLIQKPEYVSFGTRAQELMMSNNQKGFEKLLLEAKEPCEKLFNVELDKTLSEKELVTYTTIGGAPFLDNEYTVFGKVISGLEVIDKICSEPTAPGDRPLEDISMQIDVSEVAKKEITRLYGYKY